MRIQTRDTLASDEDEVSWRDPATDGAGAPVLVRGERVEDTHADSRFPGRSAIADAYLVGYATASSLPTLGRSAK
jgi:hypothetical protein